MPDRRGQRRALPRTLRPGRRAGALALRPVGVPPHSGAVGTLAGRQRLPRSGWGRDGHGSGRSQGFTWVAPRRIATLAWP